MKTTSHSVMFALVVVLAGQVSAQTAKRQTPSADDADANQWEFSLATSGYLVPDDQSYGSPIFTADHQWLHLEARYNEEYLHTGSLWAGYNFSVGQKLVFDATPMFGVVFGSTTGVAPGYEIRLRTGGLSSPLKESTYLIRAIRRLATSTPGMNLSTRRLTGSTPVSCRNGPESTTPNSTYSVDSQSELRTRKWTSRPIYSMRAGPNPRSCLPLPSGFDRESNRS